MFGVLFGSFVLKGQSWIGRREVCRGKVVFIGEVGYLRNGGKIEVQYLEGYVFLFYRFVKSLFCKIKNIRYFSYLINIF